MAGRGQPGRADKLTPDTQKKILDAVRAGAAIKDAAEHAGIGERTVYDWLERAEQPDAAAKFSQFSQALTRARADAKVGAVAVIRRAMPDEWRAAAFYLERRYPEEWGRRQALEHSGPGGGPVKLESELDLRGLSAEDLERLEEILAKAASGAAADAG